MLSMKPWISGEACCLRQTKWISLESRPATGSAWKPRRAEGMRATKLSGTQATGLDAGEEARVGLDFQGCTRLDTAFRQPAVDLAAVVASVAEHIEFEAGEVLGSGCRQVGGSDPQQALAEGQAAGQQRVFDGAVGDDQLSLHQQALEQQRMLRADVQFNARRLAAVAGQALGQMIGQGHVQCADP